MKSAAVVFPAMEETRDPTILITVYHIYVIIKVLVRTQFKTCWQFDVIWRDPSPGQRLHMSFRAVVEGKGGGRWYQGNKINYSLAHNYLRKAS